MSTILQELEATISGLKTDTTRSNVGTVREIGDGVAKIEGLSDVMLNEMIEFPGGLYGIALNLEENAVGQPIDGKGPVKSEEFYPVEKIAPGIIKRKSVSVPVQTGILPVDAMIPVGRGQRELIIGDRATGKTTIAIDTIINQARLNKAAEEGKIKNHKPLYCIYVGVGQKNMSIARTVDVL